uniref:Methylthioribose-1-phosphate isomerase n=1 Tax=Thermosporothrix sp. COM3 TaxID=2490863 RepID=A0A455SMW5_9CHLR|nr:methylthioribose-1-phosphate isomerase [Thermosporothrix sp. COM3]
MSSLLRQQRVHAVWWEDDGEGAAVCLLDQTQLPAEVVHLRLRHEQEVADAIRSLKVRGAPAIGATAAFGLCLALARLLREQGDGLTCAAAYAHFLKVAELMRGTRPTAVNLFWAIERMQRCAERLAKEEVAPSYLVQQLQAEAQAIVDEDAQACLRMGELGAELLQDGDHVLTHCNTGMLATMGWGTALAPLYIAHRQGKRIHVYVDETRPVLQGARLTAWELSQEGVPLTLITDNMAAYFMAQGNIKAVFVGADRVTANGDVANKIGTYGLAVLARAHQIPFYVAVPRSTIDLSLASGAHIPIEQRNPAEVTTIRGVSIAPAGVQVANPAFDVTPNHLITALITERGIAYPPFADSLRQICADD